MSNARVYGLLLLAVNLIWMSLPWPGAAAWGQAIDNKRDLATRADFKEPVALMSKDGVLEIRLTAKQGEATLDTVAKPVKNFLLFNYELIRGTASNGQKVGINPYPAPTL